VRIVSPAAICVDPAGAAGDSAARCVGGALRFPETGGALALARVIEVPIDSGAGNAEEVGDLLDGMVTGVVELLRESNLLGVEPGPAAPRAAASSRRRESVASVGQGQLALKLGENGSIPNIARPSAVVVSNALLGDVQTNPALA
jgi:hypothetical protein